jgi:hypothetical protein
LSWHLADDKIKLESAGENIIPPTLQKPIDSTSFAAGKNDVKIFTSLFRGKFTNRKILNINQTA